MIEFKIDYKGLLMQLQFQVDKLKEPPKELFDSIGNLLLESVKKNFMEGGRPQGWIPSQRVVKYGGKTLMVSGELMNSGTYQMTEESVILSQGAGLPFTFIHQYGGWAGRGHASYIPARPYVFIQDEDEIQIYKMVDTFYHPINTN